VRQLVITQIDDDGTVTVVATEAFATDSEGYWHHEDGGPKVGPALDETLDDLVQDLAEERDVVELEGTAQEEDLGR
jgi:hypothetical protein